LVVALKGDLLVRHLGDCGESLTNLRRICGVSWATLLAKREDGETLARVIADGPVGIVREGIRNGSNVRVCATI
jgi:hypothetical protein